MEQNIWSAHLSDELVNVQGPISKSKLDRIGNSILDEQKNSEKKDYNQHLGN